MVGFILCFLLAFTGLAFYFVWKASSYLINGQFDFVIWRKENLHRFIYSTILLILVCIIFIVQPELLNTIGASFGISFDIGVDNPENASPLLLGFSVAALTYKTIKTINEK